MFQQTTPPSYIDDATYPATYVREISPPWLNYAAVVNGARPQALDQGFRYLELGCGQGLSSAVHAAAFPHAEFHACDADPACIESARRLADEVGVDNLILHHASFAELAHRPMKPFDFIVAHGVYSWVDASARLSLRRLVAGSLASTGLASVSYNCMPGWTTEGPLRRMMVELAGSFDGDGAARALAAARVLESLAAGSAYFRLHPEAQAAVEAYLRSPSGYLAHEFLNPVFAPFYSVDVAEEMDEVGLDLLGSATLVDNHEALLVDQPTSDAVAALPTRRQRQLAMDFAVNRRFRRDLFVRRDVSPPGDDATAAAPLVGCLGEPSGIADSIQVPRGRITFESRFVNALRRLVAAGPSPLNQLAAALSRDAADRLPTVRNLLYLVAAGELAPFAGTPESDGQGQLPPGAARRWLRRTAEAPGAGWIPSPVSGGGIRLSHAEARLALDHLEGTAAAGPLPGDLRARLNRLGILR